MAKLLIIKFGVKDKTGEMAARSAKAVFVGNIKGGVGKSTLTVYLTEYLRQRFKRQGVLLIDTDPQGTSFELMG